MGLPQLAEREGIIKVECDTVKSDEVKSFVGNCGLFGRIEGPVWT